MELYMVGLVPNIGALEMVTITFSLMQLKQFLLKQTKGYKNE